MATWRHWADFSLPRSPLRVCLPALRTHAHELGERLKKVARSATAPFRCRTSARRRGLRRTAKEGSSPSSSEVARALTASALTSGRLRRVPRADQDSSRAQSQPLAFWRRWSASSDVATPIMHWTSCASRGQDAHLRRAAVRVTRLGEAMGSCDDGLVMRPVVCWNIVRARQHTVPAVMRATREAG